MNGMSVLKSISGTRYEMYWAPVTPELTFPNPSQEELEIKWGLVVIDLSWVVEDPRPKHLRAKPLGYDLKPPYEIVTYPRIDGKLYDKTSPLVKCRSFVREIHELGLMRDDGKKGDRYWWAASG